MPANLGRECRAAQFNVRYKTVLSPDCTTALGRANIVRIRRAVYEEESQSGLVVAMIDDSSDFPTHMWLVQTPPSENSVVIVR